MVLNRPFAREASVTISSGLNSTTFFYKDTTAEDSSQGWTNDIQQQTVRSLRSAKGDSTGLLVLRC